VNTYTNGFSYVKSDSPPAPLVLALVYAYPFPPVSNSEEE